MLIDPDDLAIVESVIALAKSFKIAIPMSAAEIPAWLNDWKPDDAWQS